MTTVQSLGREEDAALKQWIARGVVPGMDADVIALDGDPLVDPEAFGRVVFVMRAGKVYRSESATR